MDRVSGGTGGRGPSSFGLWDPERVFEMLAPKVGEIVVDLGCGTGDYAIEIAKRVGRSGKVHALDRSRETLDALVDRARAAGLDNLAATECDLSRPLPFPEGIADACLAVTVLHVPDVSAKMDHVLSEIRRVLHCGGRFIAVDVKKEPSPIGPPLHMRIDPAALTRAAEACGFKKTGDADLGLASLLRFEVLKPGCGAFFGLHGK